MTAGIELIRKKEAKEAYLSNFSPDWKGFRDITGVSKKLFKKWLYNGRKQQKPFADYVEIMKKKLNESQNDTFVLHGDLTDREKDIQAKKEKKSNAAKKAAETRKRKKEEKHKAEEAAFWKQQDDLGYKNLFGESLLFENNIFIDAMENYNEYDLFWEFLDDKKKGIAVKQWNLIPKEQYWNALRNYMQYGDAFRTPDYLIDNWLNLVVNNTVILYYMTVAAGHDQGFIDDEVLEDCFFGEEGCTLSGYDDWAKYLDEIGFYDWCVLPDGSDALSDYGLTPLWNIIQNLSDNPTKSEKLIAINRCLDVAHCRGDLASMFIEGGSKSCYEISHT